jgi:hypothetical protein
MWLVPSTGAAQHSGDASELVSEPLSQLGTAQPSADAVRKSGSTQPDAQR